MVKETGVPGENHLALPSHWQLIVDRSTQRGTSMGNCNGWLCTCNAPDKCNIEGRTVTYQWSTGLTMQYVTDTITCDFHAVPTTGLDLSFHFC